MSAASGAKLFHRGSGKGNSYWGPGDLYTFLVTGEESGGRLLRDGGGGASGGGPPMHTHQHENETFYVLEGRCTFYLATRRPSRALATS